MEDNKKQIIYYVATFAIAFFLGLFFDHYVLCKQTDQEQVEVRGEELGISLQEEKKEVQEDGKGEVQKKVLEENKDKKLTQEAGCTIYIDVSGALKTPGVYCLEEDSLIIDAVNKAGGLSKEAATRFIHRRINLAQPLVNNQKLYFPYENELVCEIKPLFDDPEQPEPLYTEPVVYLPTTEPYIDQNPTTTSPPDPTETTNNDDIQCVNINTATKEQLTTLNGVGDSTAEKIIQGRPYTQVEDLLNVAGIGEATLEKLQDFVCI